MFRSKSFKHAAVGLAALILVPISTGAVLAETDGHSGGGDQSISETVIEIITDAIIDGPKNPISAAAEIIFTPSEIYCDRQYEQCADSEE